MHVRRVFLLALAPLLAGLMGACIATRAEHLISPGMSAQEVRSALGEPFSRTRKVERGEPVEVWLYREVEARDDGTREARDSAVTLRGGKVVSVQALTATPADRAPAAFGR